MKLPVVVGCGLTGLAISRSLHRRGVAHLLVGWPPKRGLRLGESLNLEGTIDLQGYFPELQALYGEKSTVAFHLGEQVVACDLDLSGSRISHLLYRLLGLGTPCGFLHVDRINFDPEAFRLVTASPTCTHLAATVTDVEYDPGSDRVRTLTTSDGARLEPSFVFDATNHARIIARRVGVRATTLGGSHRIAFAHVHRASPGVADGVWKSTTHLVRLAGGTDRIAGVGWFIPFPRHASVGVSVDASVTDLSDEDLLDLTLDAVERVGIDVRSAYDGRRDVAGIPSYRHFIHDRAWGANWMLAGTTFCQVWFGTSSGVSAGFAAATCAPDMLIHPRRTGRLYQELLAALERPHGVFEWVRTVEPQTAPGDALLRRGDRLVAESVRRLLHYTRLREGRVRRLVGLLLSAGFDRVNFDFSGICRLVVAPPADQARAVHEVAA